MRFPFSLFLIGSLLFSSLSVKAGEGMWLPLLLKSLNEAEMQSMGLELTAEDIYSVNKGSLKDAIVHFGGFCTGEIISSQGLLLTNHHCGYGQIQDHSTLEHNYLEDGFWAKSMDQELPNPGLFVTFIVSMEDVSKQVLADVTPKMNELERQRIIDQKLATITAEYKTKEYQDVMIKPFYHGNKYYLFVTETYNDIRLVGAPPSSIGKFGADTDNWEWPRHAGDFSLFRIYTSPNGKPADYSKDNVPMKPRYHLPVSTQGVKEGDFTMVFGFPGRTDEYLPAKAVEIRTQIINPIRINMRDSSLAVIDRYMRQDAQIKIQYASKQARISNSWKKWIGESEGIEKTGGLGKKHDLERTFTANINNKEQLLERYGTVLQQLNSAYIEQQSYAESRAYVSELNYNIDLFRIANGLSRLPLILKESGDQGVIDYAPRIKSYLTSFYGNYRPEVDEAVAAKLLPIYFANVTEKHVSKTANDQIEFAGGQVQMIKDLFERSFLTKPEMAQALLDKDPVAFVKQLKSDLAYQFVRNLNEDNDRQVTRLYQEYQNRITLLQREYMAGLIEAFPTKRFYPDANGTMRLSYGQIEGYSPSDSVTHDYATHLSGVIEKYVPGDYEFDLPTRLLELHNNKDYGRWADSTGDVPVCLLGSNHTTGGNSGSPAINGKGELVGLNFDRVWEGTMSDINYDRSICRNIMVDIRYVLFLVDKLGGAGHLIDEMELR